MALHAESAAAFADAKECRRASDRRVRFVGESGESIARGDDWMPVWERRRAAPWPSSSSSESAMMAIARGIKELSAFRSIKAVVEGEATFLTGKVYILAGSELSSA